MAGVLEYTKKFIILKKDFCNMPGLNPKGHGKIEIKGLKGSLSISLENAEENQIYNVLLVDKNNTYNLGKVYTEKNGKGREELDFNISDLESKGFSLEKLNGILVTRNTNVLLGGYIGKEDNSIESYINSLTTAAPEKVEPEPEPVIVESIVPVDEIEEKTEIEQIEIDQIEEPKIEEVIQAREPEIVQEEVIEEQEVIEEPEPVFVYETEFVPTPEVEAVVPEESKEVEVLEEPEEVEQEIIESIELPEVQNEDIEVEEEVEVPEEIAVQNEDDPFVPEYEPIVELSDEPEPVAIEPEVQDEEIKINEFDYEYNKKVLQRNQTTTYVLSILRYFPYIDPLRVNLSGYNWWRIDYQDDDKGFLPYYSYVVGGNKKINKMNTAVTARELMTVHGHYIFGLYNVGDEIKYYVYGVPGGFYKDEHPYGGVTGFNTWYPGYEISGYWLLYIDPLTGEVIYPINPMNPTD